MSSEVCFSAASRGDLVMLKWAHEHGCSLVRERHNICETAARSHNAELMEWLIEQPGVQLTTKTMQTAAESGDRAMCELLYANSCPWDNDCCFFAAQRISQRGDDAELLLWLRQHGCPWWAQDIAYLAAHSNSVVLLEYMQQNGVVFTTEQLTELLSSAGAFDSLTTAKWLREQGAEWPAVLQNCGQYSDGEQWHGDTLAWARAEGCDSPLDYHYGNTV
eukprot:7802-Heterococcus_DN1.PRE.3